MPPKKQTKRCQVCELAESKYKCAGKSCSVVYCSVPCYKTHKETCVGQNNKDTVQPPAPALPEEQPESGPSQPFIDPIDDLPPLYPSHKRRREVNLEPLRALSTLAWPPEADPKIYTDPLTRDDPKPLRRSELMAIATSSALRKNLAATSHDPTLPTLPVILKALDSLNAPERSQALSRILGLDLSTQTEAFKVGDVWIGDRERDLVREFAETVRQTLETEDKGKAEWEI